MQISFRIEWRWSSIVFRTFISSLFVKKNINKSNKSLITWLWRLRRLDINRFSRRSSLLFLCRFLAGGRFCCCLLCGLVGICFTHSIRSALSNGGFNCWIYWSICSWSDWNGDRWRLVRICGCGFCSVGLSLWIGNLSVLGGLRHNANRESFRLTASTSR